MEFIKTLDLPTPPTARPLPTKPPPIPTPASAWLVVRVKTTDDTLTIVGDSGAFRAPLRNGRAVLQFTGTDPVLLHVEDPWGRITDSRSAAPSLSETVILDINPVLFTNASPGLRLTPSEDHAVVAAIESGSAAEAAGIQAGDLVTHIDDRACGGLSASELQEALLGDVGTAVSLRIVITNDANEREEHSTALERR